MWWSCSSSQKSKQQPPESPPGSPNGTGTPPAPGSPCTHLDGLSHVNDRDPPPGHLGDLIGGEDRPGVPPGACAAVRAFCTRLTHAPEPTVVRNSAPISRRPGGRGYCVMRAPSVTYAPVRNIRADRHTGSVLISPLCPLPYSCPSPSRVSSRFAVVFTAKCPPFAHPIFA